MTCVCGCRFCMECGRRKEEGCGCERSYHAYPLQAQTPIPTVQSEYEAIVRRREEEEKEEGRRKRRKET